MTKVTRIALFEGNKIRRHWDDKKELWYFSIIDVIQTLTGSSIPRRYWSDLKIKLYNEGSQLYEKIVQLKMKSSDGSIFVNVGFSSNFRLTLYLWKFQDLREIHRTC